MYIGQSALFLSKSQCQPSTCRFPSIGSSSFEVVGMLTNHPCRHVGYCGQFRNSNELNKKSEKERRKGERRRRKKKWEGEKGNEEEMEKRKKN